MGEPNHESNGAPLSVVALGGGKLADVNSSSGAGGTYLDTGVKDLDSSPLLRLPSLLLAGASSASERRMMDQTGGGGGGLSEPGSPSVSIDLARYGILVKIPS